MRRHDITIESSGNLQVSWKQGTYFLEIKEDLGKYCFLLWKKQTNLGNNLMKCFKTLEVMTLLFGFIFQVKNQVKM